MRTSGVAAGLVLVAIGWAAPREARACGGGVVSLQGGIVSDAQRIFFSTHADYTDVVTEIGVPATTADYGVLLPVPAQPTLDPQPVPSAQIEALDKNTLPLIYLNSPHEDNGCGCPLAGGNDNSSKVGGGSPEDVVVTHPVEIGPVTAVVLSGTSGDAVNAWLQQNGYAVPGAQQPLVASYSGTGRYFIAIRRNDTAPSAAPTSVGVHFTLPGDQRSLPLRFAQLGAAPEVAFTVLIAAPTTIAPALPFATVTLTELDGPTLRSPGYVSAARKAISARNNRAFILDGTHPAAALAGRIGPDIEGLFEPGAQVTRLTGIFPASALTDDVDFNRVFTDPAPSTRYAQLDGGSGRTGRLDPGQLRFGTTAGLALALAGLFGRRKRRR